MEKQIKEINYQPKKISYTTELPEEKKKETQEEIITKLPEWSIEPPLEIKRGLKWNMKIG